MKKLLKISLLAMLMFISADIYAYDETFSLKVKSNTQKSIMFIISEAQDLEFSIYGQENEILYKQSIHAVQPEAKTYNLDAFPDGAYLLKLETNSGITEYMIQIKNGKTLVEKPTITPKFKPVLTKQNAVITLDMDNINNGQVEVKIINEYNEELYAKVFTNQLKLSQKFNIDQTDAKELTFIVRSKDQEFIKTVSIN
jgi:hypothetical protein